MASTTTINLPTLSYWNADVELDAEANAAREQREGRPGATPSRSAISAPAPARARHGFPRSLGPPEQSFNAQWLTHPEPAPVNNPRFGVHPAPAFDIIPIFV
jgi:hypothetical protein